MLLSSFYEASVILISKSNKDNTNREKIIGQVIFVNIDINIINRVLGKPNPVMNKSSNI